MDNDELFTRVQALNSLLNKAQKSSDDANNLLKESLPLMLELLKEVRKDSKQTSLEDFPIEKSKVTDESIAPRLISELLTLEDIRKMLKED